MCTVLRTVLRLTAGVDALRLASGLISNLAQEEVGFIACDLSIRRSGSGALALWLPSSGFLCSSNDVLNERRGGGELVGGGGGGRFALGTCGDAETGPARAAQRLGASG